MNRAACPLRWQIQTSPAPPRPPSTPLDEADEIICHPSLALAES